MNKIEKLKKNIKDKAQLKADKAARKSELESRLTTIRAEKTEAAAAGDMDKFQAAKRKELDIQDHIEVLDVQLSNMTAVVDESEISAAWREYAEDFSKDLNKALMEYNKHRASLAAEYAALVRKQNEALQDREELAGLMGMPLGSEEAHAAIAARFPLNCLPDGPITRAAANLAVYVPELRFFIESGIWEQNGFNTKSVATLNNVVKLKRSIDKPEF